MIIIVSLIFIISAITLMVAGASLAPWCPTKGKDIERIHRLSSLKEGENFYELGCGDGRVCRYIAVENPKAEVIGVEMAIPIYLWAKVYNIIYPQKNLTIKYGNALNVDLSNANVVYTYALPYSLNKKLRKKFLDELKKGSRVLSYIMRIRKWEGDTYTDKPTKDAKSIHVYRI